MEALPVVEVGLRAMLGAASPPFTITANGAVLGEPDVFLFDVIHLSEGETADLERWLKETGK